MIVLCIKRDFFVMFWMNGYVKTIGFTVLMKNFLFLSLKKPAGIFFSYSYFKEDTSFWPVGTYFL